METICKTAHENATDVETKTEAQPGKEILCAVCSHPVTDMSKQIIINNAHEHTFANPHGEVFEIGCYGNAQGCVAVSAPSYEFSWFPGFSWRIGVCRTCSVHLGWMFSSDNDVFYALILDRLIFP